MKKILAATAAYVGTIWVANYVTSSNGMWPIVPGVLEATAGTYFIGVLFILRDYIQDGARSKFGKRRAKWPVLTAIAVGSLVSYWLAAPAIVLASVAAFAVAETTDWLIYTPLRERGYIRAAVTSNAVSSVVDTVLFLWIAAPALRVFNPQFTIVGAMPGQIVGKFMLTIIVVLAVALYRSRRRTALA